MNTPWFKNGDIILIAGVVLMTAMILIWNHAGSGEDLRLIATITQDGRTIRRIDLDSLDGAEYISLDEKYSQVILAEKGRIRFLDSDCPDKICVKTGWLTRQGDKAVCVPARTIIIIEGDAGRADTIAF